MGFNLRQKMGIGLAKQIAKRVDKSTFLQQLEETWFMVIEKKSGAVDIDKEVEEMRKRIKKSGYSDVFKSAGITEMDLVDTLKRVVEKSGKSVR